MKSFSELLHGYNVRTFGSEDPPELLTPAVEGQSASASLSYRASFVTLVGETLPSSVAAITNGPDPLNGLDKVRLEVASIPPSVRKVRWWKLIGGTYQLIAEVDPGSPIYGRCYDTGQSPVSSATLPVQNTSGRPGVIAIAPKPGTPNQRQSWMDLEALILQSFQRLGDTLYKNGDVITGLAEQPVSGTTWQFTEGQIYFLGQIIDIPASGNITLTGTGTETVGILISARYSTPDDDPVQRSAADEGVDPQYAMLGPDWLYLSVTWGIDQPGQIKIKEFVDNVPIIKTITTERTKLDEDWARRSYATSGSFGVRPFMVDIRDHESEEAKLYANMAAGYAFPMGWEIERKGSENLEFSKARDVGSANNSPLDPFIYTGGSVLGTAAEPFDLNGLSVKLRLDSGASHTVTFGSDGMTASAVATAINAQLNAVPTSGTLTQCAAASGHLLIKGADGRVLTVEAVASDAYTVLGIATGTYTPGGQRIYACNQKFVKTITDFNCDVIVVESVVHDGTTGKDLLGNANVSAILGASNTLADCWDEKWDYEFGVDFGRSGDYADFTLYGGSDPANGQTIYVKYKYRRNMVRGTRVRVRVTDAQIVKGAYGTADAIVFTDNTSAAEVKSGNPVTGLSGSASNVIRMLRVNDSPGQSVSQYDSYTFKKNATALGFNASQIDWSTAGAQGVLPGGQPTTGVTYYCSFEFWHTVIEGDYLASDSYLNDYAEIETYGGQNLRDAVDFRTAGEKPAPLYSPSLDMEYYLARIDKIVLDKTGHFILLSGQPALYPVAPANQSEVLPIATLHVEPYTYDTGDVTPVDIMPRRITMAGIAEYEKRIRRLENNAVQSNRATVAAEHAAAVNGTGLFSDSFIGQGAGDVQYNRNGIAFNAAIDTTNRVARLPVSEDARVISVDLANSTNVARVGKVIMAAYTETPYQEQLLASRRMNVNPDNVFSWVGQLELTPDQDFYNDVERLPTAVVNFEGNYDALQLLADSENAERGREITYGAWSKLWDTSGGWVDQQLQSDTDAHWDSANAAWGINGERVRTGTITSLEVERQTIDLGDHVVDVTVQPYCRTTIDGQPFYIECSAHGMLPNVEIAGTIDGVPVDLEPTGSTVAGSNSYQGKTTVMTDASGSATCRFAMPSGILVGTKLVKLFKYNDSDATSCLAQFVSQGTRQTVQGTTVGLASLVEKTEVVTQSEFHYGDPLAQTFGVETGIHYLSSVDVWFASKAAALPVALEMRETFEGKPTAQVVATATLYPGSVQTSDDGADGAYTRFTFANIVGYKPGEHAFVLIANTDEYEVFVAELGGTDLQSGAIIATQPAGGVLFHSPNNTYWQGETKMDMKYRINEANFQNNCQVRFNSITGIQANAFALAVTQFLPAGCNLTWSWRSGSSAPWVPFLPGLDTELGSIAGTIDLLIDITQLGGSFQFSESYAGIVCLLNKPEAWYVAKAVTHTDESLLPSRLRIVSPLAVDGVNGAGTRSVTPYWSEDDGKHLIELCPPVNYVPTNVGDGTFREWQFESPDEASVTGATNATPIVIESANHGFKNNQIVVIDEVTGNTAANGTYRIANATDDTFELVDPDTGVDIAGNGTYAGAGTINCAAIRQQADGTYKWRVFWHFTTSNRAVTPKLGEYDAVGF